MNINERNVQITIGMPVFNDVQFIEESLQSLLNQTFKDFVLIISDDGSTDGSADICKKYALIDKRIKYIRQDKNLGISKNMEFLISQAKTPYFMWAADDDLWHPKFIDKLKEKLESNEDNLVAFCKVAVIDQDEKNILEIVNIDYHHSNRILSLVNFIKNSNDGFGYGLFKTSKIRDVRFPKWWWPCHKTALNNIYPSLCYYLLNGRYVHYEEEILFFKRIKTPLKTNHTIIDKNSTIELIRFIIRRFYLCIYTYIQILRSKIGYIDKLRIGFYLSQYWLYKPLIDNILNSRNLKIE